MWVLKTSYLCDQKLLRPQLAAYMMFLIFSVRIIILS